MISSLKIEKMVIAERFEVISIVTLANVNLKYAIKDRVLQLGIPHFIGKFCKADGQHKSRSILQD